MLLCRKCGTNAEPRIIEKSGQLIAWCKVCGEYIRAVPRTSFWRAVLESQTPKEISAMDNAPTQYTPDELQFKFHFERMQQRCFDQAKEMGFWDLEQDDNPLVKLMLVITELSEAVEGYRKPEENAKGDKHLPQYTIVEVEIADAFIRLFDLAGRNQLRIAAAIIDKLRFNRTRGYRHGGRRF